MPRLRLSDIEDQHSVDARAAVAAETLDREARRWRHRKRIRLADVDGTGTQLDDRIQF